MLSRDQVVDLLLGRVIPVRYRGRRIPFHVGLFKDDLETITVHFLTRKQFVAIIDAEMEAFCAERGQ